MTETITDVVERPILFTGEMVRAILDDRKTQTRRVFNPQPRFDYPFFDGPEWYTPGVIDRYGELRPADEDVYGIWTPDGEHGWKCPHGAPGDQLYVRETWAASYNFDDRKPRHIPNDAGIWYMADDDANRDTGKTRPSIFMPRWASRIQLEVTGVRVERVQEITDEDVFREGIRRLDWKALHPDPEVGWTTPDHAFRVLWDSINADRGYPWESNPWVWAVEFRRLSN